MLQIGRAERAQTEALLLTQEQIKLTQEQIQRSDNAHDENMRFTRFALREQRRPVMTNVANSVRKAQTVAARVASAVLDEASDLDPIPDGLRQKAAYAFASGIIGDSPRDLLLAVEQVVLLVVEAGEPAMMEQVASLSEIATRFTATFEDSGRREETLIALNDFLDRTTSLFMTAAEWFKDQGLAGKDPA